MNYDGDCSSAEQNSVQLAILSGSYPLARRRDPKDEYMKKSKLKSRLVRDRPMKTISLRFPEDVIDDLKGMAPLLGFSGYQPLIRAYVSQGLRADLERLETADEVERLIESLREQGVDDAVIEAAVSGAKQ